MSRPDFITAQDVSRWTKIIESDKQIPSDLAANPTIREVCYAGLFLSEQLADLNCPEELLVRIQYTAGKMSFGRDPWEVHQQMLEDFKSNKIVFDMEPSELN
jgi:hypothetical protein